MQRTEECACRPQFAGSASNLFSQSTQLGVLECLPVFILGYSNLGMLGYPQAPPCPDGNLFLLAPSSTREKIFARVAESALCGAPHFWQSVLDASSSGLKPIGSDDSFDRRIFKELVKSTRHNLHFEGILGLITSGDALPFDLIAKNPEEYRANNQEWKTILSKIDSTLQDPSVIPQLQKILVVPDPNLRLATATALQRFHTHAAVVNLGKMLESPVVEKELGLMAAKGLADYANGCPMTTTSSFKTPADYFPHCDQKAPFRTDETVSNSRHNPEIPGDDDQKITYWKGWWLSNGNRVAALASQQP